MNKKSLAFLKRLSNSFGPPGFELEAVQVVCDYIKEFCGPEDRMQDKLGSFLFAKSGTAEKPVVLLPGHIDEVGFVVSGINEKGFLTFNPLGGWFDQVLLGQRVSIRTFKGEVHGLIAAKPPHLLSPEERKKVVTKDKMFIDVGCTNRREAEEMGLRMGDPVVPFSGFSTLRRKSFRIDEGKEKEAGTVELATGKAFDDRIGVFVAAEVIRRLKEEKIAHPNRVIGAATVQEEVGLRGARTAGWISEPDVCITLEVEISGDIPGIEPHQAAAVMGKGPAVLTFDSSMIPNQVLKELVIRTAGNHKIPYQLSQISRGGTDAGAIHLLRAGCPSIVIGVPTRHIHSHAGMVCLEDVEDCIRLLIELIRVLDQDQVDRFTRVIS